MMESIENEKEKEKEKKTKKKDVTDSRVCMTNCQQFGIQAHCVYLNKTRIEKQGTKLRMTIVKTACEASVPHPNSE